MRTYGRRFWKNSILNQIKARAETQDAILWQVLPAQRVCWVKVQGSSQLVLAHYPENWGPTPAWLKPGNCVKVMHTGGERGFVEVIGHGNLIPTPVDGGSPAPGTLDDAVLSGCVVIQASPPEMLVWVTAGTYRINGVTYVLGSIGTGAEYLDMGAGIDMGEGFDMGAMAGTGVTVGAAPSTPHRFRYDSLVVGLDGTVDVIAGAEVASDPVMPATPADHVQIGWVLLHYGMTAITQDWINRTWTDPVPSSLTVTVADQDLLWAELSTDIHVDAFDQYGEACDTPAPGLYFTLEFISGNGTLSSSEEGDSTTIIGQHGTNHAHFTYTRDQLDPGDRSPILKGTLADSYLATMAFIRLYDSVGDFMI